jgi:hypothetical protein
MQVHVECTVRGAGQAIAKLLSGMLFKSTLHERLSARHERASWHGAQPR